MAFLSATSFAQDRKPIKGKITSEASDLEGIYVINKNADITVATTAGGYFTINAKVNDTLIFSAIQFIAKELVVDESHLKDDLVFVPLEPFVRSLDEVVVMKSDITSESLGLVPKGQKRYTPGERKVYTASQGVDGIFTAISGRKKMLKKAAEYEKKENLMEKIGYLYTEEEIINEFKIPQEYVRGFIFYVVEDKELSLAVKDKNKGMAKLHLSRLSIEYITIINEGKKETDEK
jgi:hypothetical protein